MSYDQHLRQADQERRSLERLHDKVARADALIAKAEEAKAKAEAAASRASTASMGRMKLQEAQRHQRDAQNARNERAKATKAIADSTRSIATLEKRAREEQARVEKKERDARARDEKEQARRAKADGDARKREEVRARQQAARESQQRQQEERSRRAQEVAHKREVVTLRARTDELERSLREAQEAAPEIVTVLFLAGAIEGGAEPLHLDREMREIEQRLRASEYRDHVRFTVHQATQIRDIIDALNRHDPDIVHFSGHGTQSSLVFDGNDGRPQELSDDHLALLLQVARKPIRLVVFNSCLSAEQAGLATDHVEAAIGMEESIEDAVAKDFAGQLYASLAAGTSLGTAFQQAVAQVQITQPQGWGRPRLFVREGVEADQVVLVAPSQRGLPSGS